MYMYDLSLVSRKYKSNYKHKPNQDPDELLQK